MRKHYTGKQRTELVDMVRSGGTTVAEAAARLGVAPSTAYYWVRGTATGRGRRSRQAREAKATLLGQPTFVRVVSSGGVDAVMAVRVGAAEIQVRRNFDAELLRAVVEALGGGA
jgi:transposase-like protein